MRLILLVLLVLGLLAAGAGGGYYYSTQLAPRIKAGSAPAADEPPPLPAPIFLALDPFTVTLSDERISQILYLEITLRTPDLESRSQLVEYMPEVRNRVLGELARHDARQLQKTEGREMLASRLQEVLSRPYQPRPKGPDISHVLFTAFVVQ